MKINIFGKSIDELATELSQLKIQKFRAKQIHNWVYSKSVSTINEMTNLAKDFREKLGNHYIDVGIAEPHAVALASGVAKKGAKAVNQYDLQGNFIQTFKSTKVCLLD